MAEASAPEEFICPITKEMMAEPVCTADGQTYERAAIEQWFARGRTSSPITGLPLRSMTVTPNYALKNAIETYQKDRPQMEAMAHQVKDLQACLAGCERELRRANVRAAASVPNAEYVLLMKRNKRPGDAALDPTDVKRCKRLGGASSGSADAGACVEHKYDDTVAAHKLWLQQWAATTERASAQELLEREELVEELRECERGIADAEAEAAKEELRAVVQRGQMDALREAVPRKEAERDAVGAQVMTHTKPLGMDGRSMLAAIRANPVATWNGPPWTAYAELHCECLALASEKHHAHEAALAAEKAGMELRVVAHGMKAKLEDLQARLQDVDARVQAANLEAKTASDAVANFSEEDTKAKASWSERVSLQPTAENLRNVAALQEKCHASLRSVRGSLASQLKQDGKSASDLKHAGLAAGELKDVGFTLDQLKEAGFTAAQLKDVGFTVSLLKEKGFAAAQLKGAGCTVVELKDIGFTLDQLKKGGFAVAQVKEWFAAAQLKQVGFTAAQLKEGGCTAAQLKEGGFTAAQLKQAGFIAAQLKEGGFTAAQLKECGVAAIACQDAGYGAPDLFHLCTPLDQPKEGLLIVTKQGFGRLTAKDNDNCQPWYAEPLWPRARGVFRYGQDVRAIARVLQW